MFCLTDGAARIIYWDSFWSNKSISMVFPWFPSFYPFCNKSPEFTRYLQEIGRERAYMSKSPRGLEHIFWIFLKHKKLLVKFFEPRPPMCQTSALPITPWPLGDPCSQIVFISLTVDDRLKAMPRCPNRLGRWRHTFVGRSSWFSWSQVRNPVSPYLMIYEVIAWLSGGREVFLWYSLRRRELASSSYSCTSWICHSAWRVSK